jgi:hypothetical protein
MVSSQEKHLELLKAFSKIANKLMKKSNINGIIFTNNCCKRLAIRIDVLFKQIVLVAPFARVAAEMRDLLQSTAW